MIVPDLRYEKPCKSVASLIVLIFLLLTGACTPESTTRDTISPASSRAEVFVNELGDTIPTGVSTPVRMRTLEGTSGSPPQKISFDPPDDPVILPGNVKAAGRPRVVIIPEKLPTFAISSGDITTDSIVWGGNPVVHLPPVSAAPRRMKDAATADLSFLDIEQGMVASDVRFIFEDSRKYLWFGTWPGGLARYDGHSFSHFTTREGLIHNYVNSILEDTRGHLWFCTVDGVNRYDGQSFFDLKEKLTDGERYDVWDAKLDMENNIWFITTNSLSRYDASGDGRIIKYLLPFTDRFHVEDRLTSLLIDSQNNLWIGGDRPGGLFRHKLNEEKKIEAGDTFVHYTTREGLIDNVVQAITEDSRGNIWIGTEGGVSMYDGRTFTQFTVDTGLSGKAVFHIHEDRKGNIWFATNGGVDKYTPGDFEGSGSFTNYSIREGLSNNNANFIREDEHGNIWVGTELGVSRLDPDGFRHRSVAMVSGSKSIRSIEKDDDGRLWLGHDGGIMQYAPSSRFNMESKLQTFFSVDNTVTFELRGMPIFQDNSGDLWFSRYGVGLYHLDNDLQSLSLYDEQDGLANTLVWSLYEDSKNYLWMGYFLGGVTRFGPLAVLEEAGEEPEFSYLSVEQGLSDYDVWDVIEDHHGYFWFGTAGGGVARYDPGLRGKPPSLLHLTTLEGLSSNRISSILEDSRGYLWLGSEGGGLNLFKNTGTLPPEQGIIHFGKEDGLSSDYILSSLEDENGNIWVLTSLGL
ncbi:MAG: two-component regulator propeller domain-containing protein, partial [Saprospiraceae bacterium]|nr:two-component regulator propeller domain-containing protein [Saprospiraceae bacterium]